MKCCPFIDMFPIYFNNPNNRVIFLLLKLVMVWYFAPNIYFRDGGGKNVPYIFYDLNKSKMKKYFFKKFFNHPSTK